MDDISPFPNEIVEIDGEEMLFAMSLASAAASREYPIRHPGEVSFQITDDKKNDMVYRLTDCAENRMGMASLSITKGIQ